MAPARPAACPRCGSVEPENIPSENIKSTIQAHTKYKLVRYKLLFSAKSIRRSVVSRRAAHAHLETTTLMEDASRKVPS